MLEPVKPLTTCRPSFLAARAVFFSSSAALALHAGRIAVAPDVLRQDRLMAQVDRIQNGLADQVIAEREHLQAVLGQRLPLTLAVAGIGHRLGDLEVVAVAAEFESVEAEILGLGRQRFQRQVGPLACT